MKRFDTILKICPDLSQTYDMIIHDEILKNLSKLQTKWHTTTTKLFLGPLSTSERSKIFVILYTLIENFTTRIVIVGMNRD